MSGFDLATSIALGIGLAAAAGLRVFVPLLLTSAAAYSGHWHLAAGFTWLGTAPALIMLAVAAVVEVLGYCIPVVDHLLDVIMTPAALVAGTLLAALVMTDLPPVVKWAVAIIAGGGAAGLTQGSTALLRAASTTTTAGLGNPVISTVELGGALGLSLLALLAPLLAAGVVAVVLPWMIVRVVRTARRRTHRNAAEPRAD